MIQEANEEKNERNITGNERRVIIFYLLSEFTFCQCTHGFPMETIWPSDPRSCDWDKTSACNSILLGRGSSFGLELIGWLYMAALCWISTMVPLEWVCLHKHSRTKGSAELQLSFAGQTKLSQHEVHCSLLPASLSKWEHPGKDAMKGWLQSTAPLWTRHLKSWSSQRLNEAKSFCWAFQMLTSRATLYFHSNQTPHLYWLTLPFPLPVPQDDIVWSHFSLLTMCHSSSFPIPFCSLLPSSFNPKVCFSLPISYFTMFLFPPRQGSSPWYGWCLTFWGQEFGSLSDRKLCTVQGSIQSNMMLIWTVRAGYLLLLILWLIAIWAGQVSTKPIGCL